MTVSEINHLAQKAKNRKDGVYSFRGNIWAVKNGCFVAFAEYGGECYQRSGSFNVSIGNVDHYDRKKKLLELLRSF